MTRSPLGSRESRDRRRSAPATVWSRSLPATETMRTRTEALVAAHRCSCIADLVPRHPRGAPAGRQQVGHRHRHALSRGVPRGPRVRVQYAYACPPRGAGLPYIYMLLRHTCLRYGSRTPSIPPRNRSATTPTWCSGATVTPRCRAASAADALWRHDRRGRAPCA